MKRLLITGASGFVGEHLLKRASHVFETHAMYFRNTPPDVECFTHRFDLSKYEAIPSFLDELKPDIIIHTAAISKPDVCENNKELALKINTEATREFASWSEENRARFIFTSTDMVFDGRKGNYKESDSVNPLSFYAETKVRAEELITGTHANAVVARLALVYGLGISTQKSFFEHLLSNAKRRKPTSLFYDQFRTPILVNNLAAALVELAEHDFTGILHLSGGERISRYDFGVKTCEIFGLPLDYLVKKSMFDIETSADRPQDVSMKNDLACGILKTKLLNCNEGLIALRKMGA